MSRAQLHRIAWQPAASRSDRGYGPIRGERRDRIAPVPIRVGLVGYGFAGRTFHAPLVEAAEGLSLVAVTSGDAEKVHADLPSVTMHCDLETMLGTADIDLVIVATPNETHVPLSRMALEAGSHVVVDKPFTLDLEEARELIRTAGRVDRHL